MNAPRPIPPDAVLRKQAEASDPAASVFVAANAGSGKTFVLAQRVIRLLLNGVDPAKILCITFTKAAAANMANQVFRTLRALPTDSRCLVQSLVLSQMLGARGIPSTLVIGARSQPEFEAHAWVEYDGRPVLPPRDFQDARLVEL